MKKLLILSMVLLSNCATLSSRTGPQTIAVPDRELLRDTGPSWWYKSEPAPEVIPIKRRSPTEKEERFVLLARKLLRDTPAKALVLLDGDEVVDIEYKSPASEHSMFWSASMGKSVLSLATGKAICSGKLTLQTRVQDWVPELSSRPLGKATVRDLLRMSTQTSQPNKDSSVWSDGQLAKFEKGGLNLLDLLMEERISGPIVDQGTNEKTGAHFLYKSTDPIALGIMVSRATQLPYATWVQQSILNPMGIANPGLFDLDRRQEALTSSGVRLRLEDWIRFALWVRRASKEKGCFGDYVRSAMERQIENPGTLSSRRFGSYFSGYGYFFWTDNEVAPRTTFAVGLGGQRISWDQDSGRIVIAFSNAENWMSQFYKLVRDWNQH